jgi:hypothetical protein
MTIGCAMLALLIAVTVEARAIVKGNSSSLGSHVVRIYTGYYCSGAAIGRHMIVTAAHCASRRMRIIAGGVSISAAGIARSATLDDGRKISVSGDAAIVRLAAPLPASITPLPVGAGEGDSYTIAGYGTPSERNRGAFGTLREARLVAAEPHALVDPNRSSSIGASACFGDSGGPVLRGSALIGIISRAAHPSPRIACGHLTRWVPIVVSGTATTSGQGVPDVTDAETSQVVRFKPPRRTAAKKQQAPHAAGAFSQVPPE